jgi:deoxyadenosine/deoxycytidine kinase
MISVIWVEGLLAAGKSTFCQKMAKKLGFLFLEEPVGGNFYLGEFYKNPKLYAFGMQMFLLHYRFAMKQVASYSAMLGTKRGVILDRSVAGDRVFAKLHHDCSNISDLDWRCYQYAYEVTARTIQPPTLLIYLDVQPETAYRRMKSRKRKAESEVPLRYLKRLHDGYEELLSELKRGLVPWSHSVEVTRIVWDRETLKKSEWDAVIATVQSMCRRSSLEKS